MDNKNVLLAVLLSTIVLIFWAVFFEPPVVEQQDINKQTTKNFLLGKKITKGEILS